MASTTSDSHGLLSSSAALASAFPDDHTLFPPSTSSTFLVDQGAASCFHHPTDYSFRDAAAQDPSAPTAARKQTRKRPRPSRRPPTTVLTTEASNFRAMVQEFTGFPVAPTFAAPQHLRPGGVLVDTAWTRYHFKLPFPAPSQTYPPTGTTINTNSTSSLVLNALAMFTKNNGVTSAAASAASTLSSGSDLYRSYGPVVLRGAGRGGRPDGASRLWSTLTSLARR
ncbi:flocculation protein FLO11-like [Hordeum vulgare]|uniref:VQ motif-containing protein 22-like n=1 Tax=Hordeum vulgare subsp. vulgare TaxID=112509 RepID=UPI001D1A53F0|nr:VQ motif-containing protein 22-like [Hordeum vulgare subsp. vulgare]KAE8814199.1 flocculation protein FLO11-like [Hordeum vulgare]